MRDIHQMRVRISRIFSRVSGTFAAGVGVMQFQRVVLSHVGIAAFSPVDRALAIQIIFMLTSSRHPRIGRSPRI